MAAEHSKSLAPNILFLDGSLARNNFTEQSFAPEALTSPAVDIFSCESIALLTYRRFNTRILC